MIHHNHEQGSEAWLAARKGCITGSRFKDCRDKLKSGGPSKACIAYAQDTARERIGGIAPAKFQNAAMRTGTGQEPLARLAYERRTGNLVEEVGFFTTEDGLFGLSPDGLIDDDGVLEIKTMVSSDTLFTAVADGDLSAYMDQCLGYLWLPSAKAVNKVSLLTMVLISRTPSSSIRPSGLKPKRPSSVVKKPTSSTRFPVRRS
jgi:exodeoxyribonuclease (lambda-induced)